MNRAKLAPERLIGLLRDGEVAEFFARARMLEAADLADVLALADDEERVEIAKLLPPDLTGEALIEMPGEEHAGDTLAALPTEQAAEILEELPDDDAADILGGLGREQQQRILAAVEPEDRRTVEMLLSYDQESAGGLMTGEMVTLDEAELVRDALDNIRRQAADVEDFSQIYIIDAARHLKGILGFKQLVLGAPERSVRELMEEPDVTVGPDMDQEEVARLMARYNVPCIPVVDRDGRLLGQITFDDVSDVVEMEATEDLLRFGGVSAQEDLGAPWFQAVKTRLPWLLVNLVTAFAAGAVVAYFQPNISRFIALTVWMPVIAGMGGNAGTQALAVTVRRLALGQVSQEDFRRVVVKEALLGMTNGLALGVVVTLVALVTGQPSMFGLLVFLAMTGNLFVAGFAGATIPLLLKRFNIDPAIASSIFVTTFTDVCGFALLLGLGGLLLI